MRGTLSHVEIYVKDLEQSLSFWDWFLKDLGYDLYQSWPQGKSYKLGSTYLCFVRVEDKHQDQSYHRKKAGLNHLAFHGGTLDDLEKMRKKLIEQGIKLLYNEGYDGDYKDALYFEDPDRMKVELVLSNEASFQ